MPIKAKKAGARKRQRGRGWSDFTNWVKGATGTVNNWLKNTKITSTIANAIKNADMGGLSKVAGAVGEVAGKYGYGRRKRYIRFR